MLKTANSFPTYHQGAIAWFLAVKLIRDVKSANIDWTGIATIVGFIAMAFWLRHVTGMG